MYLVSIEEYKSVILIVKSITILFCYNKSFTQLNIKVWCKSYTISASHKNKNESMGTFMCKLSSLVTEFPKMFSWAGVQVILSPHINTQKTSTTDTYEIIPHSLLIRSDLSCEDVFIRFVSILVTCRCKISLQSIQKLWRHFCNNQKCQGKS